MSQKAVVSFVESDYSAFSTSGTTNIALTEKQRALLLSCAVLLSYRRYWQDMTDANWDALSDEIADLLELLQV